ncbi:MAG: hypothetical protein PQJ46_02885 [Spirochaetales bacterium]|nr:hypothetical protein [Spirochaetales bacterium]
MRKNYIDLQKKEDNIRGKITDLESKYYSQYYETSGTINKNTLDLTKDAVLSKLGAPACEGQTGDKIVNDIIPNTIKDIKKSKDIKTQIEIEIENYRGISSQRMTAEKVYSSQIKYRSEKGE